jgi:hypothetical protein
VTAITSFESKDFYNFQNAGRIKKSKKSGGRPCWLEHLVINWVFKRVWVTIARTRVLCKETFS